jgi:hypothetical protein
MLSLIALAALLAEPAATAAPAAPTPFKNKDDAKIICRTLVGTGSRLDTQRVCLPKREWDRMYTENSEGLLKKQSEHSTTARTWGQ